MSIQKLKYRLTPALIADAPDASGVYALWEGDELVYIGRALQSGGGIRAMLLCHLERELVPCADKATYYSWELTLSPAARELEVLREFKKRFGKLPRCNEDAA